MNLSAEQIESNWNELLGYIESYISEPRRERLLDFYNTHSDKLILLPASHKKEYHNAFPGGYVEHVLRVIKCALGQHKLWEEMGTDTSTYTMEELVFSALNHDLGKMGDEHNASYIPQTDKWRKEKLGEDYMFNSALPFASVPDRGLFLLQSHGVTYTFNEMITIQTHDGLYDEANKKYLMGYLPEQKPRTALPFIVHQADLMAARIEFEREWLANFKNNLDTTDSNFILSSTTKQKPKTVPTKQKALGSFQSEGLKNMLDNL
jgi:hypothetical protein